MHDTYIRLCTQVPLDETDIAWTSDVSQKFNNTANGTTGQNYPPFAHWRAKSCAVLPDPLVQAECESYGIPEAGWCYPGPHMAHHHTVYLPLGALLSVCLMCGYRCYPGSGYCAEDQHFMVWMRSAGLPSFRKLYATLHVPLEAGTYAVRVSNGEEGSGGTYVNAFTGEAQTFLYPVSTGTTRAALPHRAPPLGALLIPCTMCGAGLHLRRHQDRRHVDALGHRGQELLPRVRAGDLVS